MSELPDLRIAEILSDLEEGQISVDGSGLVVGQGEKELLSLLEEVKERRKRSNYTRKQRLDFMLRMVKDMNPEIARELRDIYNEQENAIYYARRDTEYWRGKVEGNESD